MKKEVVFSRFFTCPFHVRELRVKEGNFFLFPSEGLLKIPTSRRLLDLSFDQTTRKRKAGTDERDLSSTVWCRQRVCLQRGFL